MSFHGHSAGSLLDEVFHESSNVSTEDNERERPGETAFWNRSRIYILVTEVRLGSDYVKGEDQHAG